MSGSSVPLPFPPYLPLPLSKLPPVALCHGFLTNHLPPSEWIIEVCRMLTQSPPKMMLMMSDRDDEHRVNDFLNHIANSEFNVVLYVENSLLHFLANPRNAATWVRRRVTRFPRIVTDVCVGDLSDPNLNIEDLINVIMNIIQNIPVTISVSTMVDVSMLVDSETHLPYTAMTPPSRCEFHLDNPTRITSLLQSPKLKDSSFMLCAKIFPYFQINHPLDENIRLSNYLINDDAVNYIMNDSGYSYKYVYDAMLDSICCALGKLSVEVPLFVITGWPTHGPNPEANTPYQKTYLGNLSTHVREGTPRKPGEFIQNYIYSVVDQDKDPRPEPEWEWFGIVPSPSSNP